MKQKAMIAMIIMIVIIGVSVSTIVYAMNQKNDKGTFYIDKPFNTYEFNSNIINIEGWWMSTDKNAIMKIYIDGKDTKADMTERVERPDVLKAIQGYGEESTNPLPGFKTHIDISSYIDGNYILTYKLESQNGIVLAKEEYPIKIDRSIKGTFDIDTPNPYKERTIVKENKITVQGWIMATSQDITFKIAIDGKQTNSIIDKRVARPDVLAAIQGYGDASINAKPGFEMIVDVSEYEQGKHEIQYELQTMDGKVIEKKVGIIWIQKGEFDIDTPNPYKNNITIKENVISISGWYLASDKNSKIKIFIDNEEIDMSHQRRVSRPDVLSAVQGYGGASSNPLPGFTVTIDLSKYKSGSHEILYQLVDERGKEIANRKAKILLKKGEFDIDTPNPYKKNITIKESVVSIEGWYLSSDKNSKMKIFIDNEEINTSNEKRLARPDVLSAVQGYGGASSNPLPGFTVTIDLSKYKSGSHEIIYQLVNAEGEEMASKKATIILQKGQFDIDKPHKQYAFYGKTMKIEGWLLSTDKNATMKVYIDDEDTNAIIEKRVQRPDVLSAISGYGGATNNPLPGFTMSIDLLKYTVGKHTLKYSLVTETGEIIAERTVNITIDNTDRGTMYLEYPSKMDIEYGVSLIQGWEMSTYPNATIEIKIDGKKVKPMITRTERPDVIKAITDFGDISTNPTPGFSTYMDLTQYNLGEHQLEVTLISSEGKELSRIEKRINIFKNITNGIDVSEFNGFVDWNAVKQTQDFAMIRVGYRGYRNPVLKLDAQFYKNIQSAQALGLNCGIYFFSQAINEQEAIEEANWVVDMISRYRIRYPIAFDSEWSNKNHDGRADYLDKWERTKIAKAFLNTIRERGYIPAIYASRDWLYNQLDRTQLTDFDTWVAHYTGDVNNRTDYQGAYSMWQYTSTGWVNGVNGNVDRNICYKRYI